MLLLAWRRRWDCEESTQVWQNCADVILTGSDKDEIAAAEKLVVRFSSGCTRPAIMLRGALWLPTLLVKITLDTAGCLLVPPRPHVS